MPLSINKRFWKLRSGLGIEYVKIMSSLRYLMHHKRRVVKAMREETMI